MTKQRRAAIYTFSENIRFVLKLATPVNLLQTIDNLNGRYTEDSMDDDISGKIQKTKESFIITLNKKHSENRKNFTIAHELGHLFLHMGYLIDIEKWKIIDEYIDSPYYRLGYSDEENEANHFAGAFLMPKDEYLTFVNKNAENKTIRISLLSSHFRVSDEAALTRGKWLGIFKWD